MTTADVPWHWLRPNHASRYPRRHVVLDAEALAKVDARGETHTFRCAHATFDRIDAATLEPERTDERAFSDAGELWQWVAARAVKKERTIVWAHNLAYDLRVTRALELLPADGWTLEFLTLDSSRCVARWARDGRKLTMLDSASWWPTPLERIASTLDLVKHPLPGAESPTDEWAERCRQDVAILRAAVLRLLQWLERGDMGSFRMTGAAQSMAAYRHRFMPRSGLLVHRDEDALAAERRAAWTGRCELYRHGKVDGPIEEWDYRLCYLHIARDAELPVRLHSFTGPLSEPMYRVLARRRRVLCDVHVEQSTPALPCRLEGRVVWPVGSFRSTVWDVELELAREQGARVTIERAWTYYKGRALEKWGDWLLGALEGADPTVGELEQLMLKHWARALIGRFALRYPRFEQVATLDTCDIELVPFVDLDDGSEGHYLQVGTGWHEKAGLDEAASSMPAIMSAVMAQARVNLQRAVDAAGAERVLYVDTDSLIVTRAGGRRLRAWAREGAPTPLRLKGSWSGGAFEAPRRITVGDELRASGVPRKASRVGPGRYQATVWEGLAESIRAGRPGAVRLNDRTFRLRAPDRRRRHLPGGATAPIVVALEDGRGE